MDHLFLYLGIYVWIRAGKNSATWHVSVYIPILCMRSALRVETKSWEHYDATCDKCGLQAI